MTSIRQLTPVRDFQINDKQSQTINHSQALIDHTQARAPASIAGNPMLMLCDTERHLLDTNIAANDAETSREFQSDRTMNWVLQAMARCHDCPRGQA
jgi:hypothetical protein